jgi:predicted alpha/beta superfamily hydrolase
VIPEVIVIGVPSSGENRDRDYTPPYMEGGQADRFLRFFEAELIPHVDRSYRTTPQRMLAGWSRGGLFVVYSLLERPDLFAARFAHSPALWRDDDRIVKELAKARLSGFLYLSLGDRENDKMVRAFRKAIRELQATPHPQLRWRADITASADHQSNARLATPVGLYACAR